MKNKLSIIATSLALLVLASCNSSVNISKRRYNKGYYVSVSDAKKTTTEATASTTKESKKLDALAINSKDLFSKQIENITEETPLVATTQKSFTTVAKTEKTKALAYTAIANKAIQQVPAKKMNFVQKAIANKIATSSFFDKLMDDMKVIIIILCFFIPPLAVYLHQDDITNDFWINLILTLLCGIPGVIHALIVVLRD